MADKKDKTLTTRFDSQTMAEFSVAVGLLGARSINALVHQMVHQKINEAKKLTDAAEFQKLVEAQKEESLERSRVKSKERLEILGAIVPSNEATAIKVLPGVVKVERKKAS